jgi:hypothetical protein
VENRSLLSRPLDPFFLVQSGNQTGAKCVSNVNAQAMGMEDKESFIHFFSKEICFTSTSKLAASFIKTM